MTVQNISNSDFDVELQVTIIDNSKKTFTDKVKDLFRKEAPSTTIKFGRKTAKTFSTFLHAELMAADKAYKDSTKEKTDEKPAVEAPKTETLKTKKPRKKPTSGENTGTDKKTQK